MSRFSAVQSRFVIDGVTNSPPVGFSSSILTVLEYIYNTSDAAMADIDIWLALNPSKDIIIKYQDDTANAALNGGKVNIDPSWVTSLSYISKSGSAVAHSLISVLAHELSHAVTLNLDNDSLFYMAGDNVNNVNNWYSELGVPQQLSYAAQYDPSTSWAPLVNGMAYTDNNVVSNVIYDRGYYSEYSLDTGVVYLASLFVSGSSLMIGGSSVNNYGGSTSRDWIYGEGGADHLDGDDGDDFIFGGSGNDTLVGGKGNDVLWGGAKDINDGTADGVDIADYSSSPGLIQLVYRGGLSGYSVTVLDGFGGTDTLRSIEKIIGTDKADILQINGNILAASGSAPTITFDAAHGQSGRQDIINGNKMAVGTGFTIYIGPDGVGTVTDNVTGGIINLLNFDTDAVGTRSDDTITDLTEGAKQFYGGDGNDIIEISGSLADSRLYGGLGDDTLTGGAGNDIIYGDEGNNVLNGGDGDDFLLAGPWAYDQLNGGDGDDYLLSRGYGGNEVFNGEAGDDLIQAFTTLSEYTEGGSATVKFSSGDGHDTVVGQYVEYESPTIYSGPGYTYTGIGFVDLSSLSIDDVEFIWDADYYHGQGDTDEYHATSHFLGDLAIVTSTGDSLFIPGVRGKVTWFDSDLHTDAEGGGLHFENLNILLSEGWLQNIGDSYWGGTTHYSIGDVSGYNVALGAYDGHGLGEDVDLEGTSGDDEIDSDGRDGSLDGGDGDDTFGLMGGNVAIEGGNGNDQVRTFRSLGDYQRSFDGTTFTLTGIAGSLDTASLHGVETIYSVTDGKVYTIADLILQYGTAGNDVILGTDFNDIITGQDGNDTITPGEGNDSIDAGNGTDEVIYDGLSTDFRISRELDGSVSVQSLFEPYKYDVLLNVESIYFVGDAETLLVSALPPLGTSGNDIITGTARGENLYGQDGNDSINGLAGDDTLAGGAGDDILVGGSGNDYLFGENGDDTLVGEGDDYLSGGRGSDTYSLENQTSGFGETYIVDYGSPADEDTLLLPDADYVFSAEGDHLIITSNLNASKITVDSQFMGEGLEKIDIDDGAEIIDILRGTDEGDVLTGSSGRDIISALWGDDLITGGAGDDLLVGGAGEDTFAFGSGFGLDTIADFSTDDDVLRVGTGVFADWSYLLGATTQVGDDLVISYDASNEITLKNVLLANFTSSNAIFV